MQKFTYLLFLCFLISCGPITKEHYLQEFESFISDTELNHKQFTEKDWQKHNEEFTKLSTTLLEKFQDDLTWKEQIKIQKYKIQYKFYSSKSTILGLINNEDVQELKHQIKEYKDNGLEKDLNFLINQAEEIGGTASETIKEIFKELEIQVNDF